MMLGTSSRDLDAARGDSLAVAAVPATGVYVHWPYCARICPYCDFNVRKNRAIDAERWRDGLVRDLEFWREKTGARNLRSLYFGGGTPSLAPLSVIESVISACDRLWGFEAAPEITLEANPAEADQSRFATFAAAGVNRLSLGVQSFDDEALAFLGRDHSADDALRALDLAKTAFPRASFDLIYGLPDQSADAWRKALRSALDLAPEHLSVYQLTIEPGTAFALAVARKDWSPPDDDLGSDLFDIAQEATAAAGLPAYEISNHARPGTESRHNLLYWTGGDYVGVGPGAHGRITVDGERHATEAAKAPEVYLRRVEAGADAMPLGPALDAETRLIEKLLTGLRLSAGLSLTPKDFAALGARAPRIGELCAEGLLSRDGSRLWATARGRRALDAVIAALLA